MGEVNKKIKTRSEIVKVEHLVDCWRLLKESITEEPWVYPNLKNVHEEKVRSHLYEFIMSPNFYGMILKTGRKPIGQILGQTQFRNLGNPGSFLFVWNFWFKKEYRKYDFPKSFTQEYFKKAASYGIMDWEANASDKLSGFLVKYRGYETKILYNRIGGRCY